MFFLNINNVYLSNFGLQKHFLFFYFPSDIF